MVNFPGLISIVCEEVDESVLNVAGIKAVGQVYLVVENVFLL